MEKVVELTEKELDTMVQNKARIDELHLGGKCLLMALNVLLGSHEPNLQTAFRRTRRQRILLTAPNNYRSRQEKPAQKPRGRSKIFCDIE
jgi:hypothetical protein